MDWLVQLSPHSHRVIDEQVFEDFDQRVVVNQQSVPDPFDTRPVCARRAAVEKMRKHLTSKTLVRIVREAKGYASNPSGYLLNSNAAKTHTPTVYDTNAEGIDSESQSSE